MTLLEELKDVASLNSSSFVAELCGRAADQIEVLQKSNEALQKELREWRNERFEQAVVAANNELKRQNTALVEALEKILRYLVHSEPVGGAMAMQDIAHKAIAAQPDGNVAPKWYTSEEMRHWLRLRSYSPEIANELSDQYADNLQKSFEKGYELGKRESVNNAQPEVEP